MKIQSPKLNFLSKHEEQDYFDNLIMVERSAYKPGPTATRMHMSLARTKIMRGGLGSGKTRSAGEHGNNIALQYPGSTGVVGRLDMTVLKETTQKEFLEKVVSPETVQSFNVNENKLYYKNGSTVLFRDTKDPDSFKSYEISWFLIDEADENASSDLWFKLDQRLRQKIYVNGEWIQPPFCGMLVFNPTDEFHWLYELANRTDVDVEDFRFSTLENEQNLPDSYIPNLIRSLPPYDIPRLVHGHWGRQVKGKPVIHGFTQRHVRHLTVLEHLPLLRGWDFGFNHPCVKIAQFDPLTERYFVLREFLGHQQYLNAPQKDKLSVIDEVRRMTASLVGPGYPIRDFCDPHGADKKDNAQSSVDTLRTEFHIHCIYQRQRIKKGVEILQQKVISDGPLSVDEPEKIAPLMLVDPSCTATIGAYSGGYHRGEDGEPVKDDYFDHPVDVDRYIVVNNETASLANRHKQRKPYVPRNRVTGY